MNRLLIIDGNAMLHRAFHAIPPLTAPDGKVVNAVYGFTAMVLRLHHDLAPTHITVAFDRPAPTFRKKMFNEYQMKRPKMDDTLVPQIPIVHDVVTALGIPIFEKDGFEADDVIGTICMQVKDDIDQVVIVTGDRDILQLVHDDRILVYMPTKGLSEAKLYHENDVVDRMGVDPNHIVDFKGLAGDSSDNYPGVEGIGPKTAVDLIHKFGTIEKLYKSGDKGNWGNLKSGIIVKLQKGKEAALLSKNLATIRRDVPLELNVSAMQINSLNTPEAQEIIGRLHFHSLLKRLTGQNEMSDMKQEVRGERQEKQQKKENQQQELF